MRRGSNPKCARQDPRFRLLVAIPVVITRRIISERLILSAAASPSRSASTECGNLTGMTGIGFSAVVFLIEIDSTESGNLAGRTGVPPPGRPCLRFDVLGLFIERNHGTVIDTGPVFTSTLLHHGYQLF